MSNRIGFHQFNGFTNRRIGPDGDGIFDLLDVPHRLAGTGYMDGDTSTYHFSGVAHVQTLPNLNSSGLRNDITINRIREIEYRFDGGDWQLYSAPDAYEVDLDLSIPVPDSATEIEIRARDSKSTVTSNVFVGRLSRADATPVPGINGFVWVDENENGLRDLGELGSEFWSVSLVDDQGNPLDLRTRVEPDEFPDGQLTNGAQSGYTLSTVGSDADGRVAVFTDNLTSTGTKNFRGFSRSTRSYLSSWNSATRRLQADFSQPTSVVQIDAVGTSNSSFGRLEAYNSAGQLVGRFTTSALGLGQVETMSISRGVDDIAYVIVGGHANTSVKLDNLRFGPESATTTGKLGEFQFPSLAAGSYAVQVESPSGFVAFSPAGGTQQANVSVNTATVDVDFGFQPTTSPWQNPVDKFDVNNDQVVSAIDVLLIVNEINANGSRDLSGSGLPTPPYIDVTGDNFVSALDVLQVVNRINEGAGGGEGELLASWPDPNSGMGEQATDPSSGGDHMQGEGEAAPTLLRPIQQDPHSRQQVDAVLAAGFSGVWYQSWLAETADDEPSEEDLLETLAWATSNQPPFKVE